MDILATPQEAKVWLPEDYRTYIGSWRWLTSPARVAELEASGFRCRACDRGPPDVRLEVHHRCYARLGRELARDLTTFCSECHKAITCEMRGRRYATTTLPVLSDPWRILPPRDLALSGWIDV